MELIKFVNMLSRSKVPPVLNRLSSSKIPPVPNTIFEYITHNG